MLRLFEALSPRICRHQNKMEQSIESQASIVLCVACTWRTAIGTEIIYANGLVNFPNDLYLLLIVSSPFAQSTTP